LSPWQQQQQQQQQITTPVPTHGGLLHPPLPELTAAPLAPPFCIHAAPEVQVRGVKVIYL
jgi:hypothetical protein